MRNWHRLLLIGLGVAAMAVALALIAPWGQDPVAANGTIHYVDADATTGANNGSSWGDAYTILQPALDAALSGDQIWVAAGTYTPTAEHGGSGDRYRSFQMKNGVAIYGGFDPTVDDDTWEERDWVAHPTILSGDLDGDDGENFANNEENSYHVFYHPEEYTDLDSSAILDGFTISGGNADGDSHTMMGGGMQNYFSSPTLTNCTFSSNSANRGGGMFNDNSASPTLTNCTFELNEAGDYGGGMVNWHSSSPVLSDCIFEGNSAGLYGGGMYNWESSPTLANCTFAGNSAVQIGGGMSNIWYSSPTLTNCTFEDNSAEWFGGAMWNDDSSPILTDCTFSGNSANYGGAMAVRWSSTVLTNCTFAGNSAGQGGGGMYSEGSSPTLANCTFAGNSAGGYGGGMINWEDSSPTLTNCTFASNSANYGGGMMNMENSAPALTNCTFFGNSAGYDGGGMCNSYLSSPTLTNCTFSGNSAEARGGGMYNWESSLTLTNCILWGDSPQEIYNSESTPVVTYSDVQGGYPGEGNIDAPPFFVDPDDGDFHLRACSPCIDAGDPDPEGLPDYDFEGDDRIIDGDDNGTATVDMGVDEVVDGLPCMQVYLPVVLRGY